MDNRQNLSEISAKFSVEWVVFSVFFLSWVLFAFVLCFLGFGSDTDAWLMARTAALLRDGEGYDPARSFGNPAWEFLLVLLQPKLEFLFSNLLNLLIGLLFLWRLRNLVPEISLNRHLLICLLLCCIPLFTEAATSSMELMPAWYLWLECLIAFRCGSGRLFSFLFTILCLTRSEFLPLMLPGIFLRRNWLVFFLPGLLAAFGCMLSGWGKNPLPFSSLNDALTFYSGRIWFILRQAGLLLPILLFFIRRCLNQTDFLLRYSGMASLGLFCIFPFEWAYVFPAIFSGLLSYTGSSGIRNLRGLFLAGLIASLLTVFITPLSGLAGLYLHRKTMLAQFQLAKEFIPKKPLLLLDGATFLPTDYTRWIRSMQNRLFRKKNTRLFVAEKMTRAEVDSFRRSGYGIYHFSGESNASDWLKREENN